MNEKHGRGSSAGALGILSGFMRTSLIITTYNWPEALELTLASVARQSLPPDEVVIADDGSGPATRELIERWRSRLNAPLTHVWQPDEGFRLARSRNRAIAAASHEYLVLVDGDMVLHRHFVRDHVACARPDCFIQGARPQLSAETTRRLLNGEQLSLGWWTAGLQRRPYAWRNPWLSRMTSRIRDTLGGIQGCNQSFWRKHALQVNGYDERFNGWGPEDREFAARLLHLGVRRNYVRHRAVAFHLHHATRAPADGVNPLDKLLQETLAARRIRCDHGIEATPGPVGAADSAMSGRPAA
jgi:glycosyltransferase involved in cell wall biosynthesis